MSEDSELNAASFDVKQLLCSLCGGFLSCAPLRVLPDGSIVCGRCTPVDELAYPVPTLERILSNTRFPCMYRGSGCTAHLLFGRTAEHEAFCDHRLLTCVSLPYTPCLWQGPAMQVLDHFTLEHSDLVQQHGEFDLVFAESKQEILMVVEANCVFVVNYSYDAVSTCLKYAVGCFTPNLEEDLCRIKLSSLDSDYMIFTKGCKCILYNQNMFNSPHAASLDVSKYLECLNNPKNITITLLMPKCKIQSEVVEMPSADYDFLASNICDKCHYYLIPPLYDMQDSTVCRDCVYTCRGKETSNKELEKTLMEQYYPCRWRGCDSVVKGNAIHNHEVKCEYRTYRCIKLYCDATVNRFGLTSHLQRHNFQFISNKWILKLKFLKGLNSKYAFTILRDEIILLSQYVGAPVRGNMKRVHYMTLRSSSLNPSQFSANVCYEHDHCKRRRKVTFKEQAEVTFYDEIGFPSCFTVQDELTVTIRVTYC